MRIPQFDLGGGILPECKTEGIKYAGSKRYLVPQIISIARQLRPDSVLDGFSGSTRLSQAFADENYAVTANDISAWSEVFATAYLMSDQPREYYVPLVSHLNSLEGKDGWFTQYYGGDRDINERDDNSLKRPWQKHNTRRLDAIREEIETLNLSHVEKCVAISSLILALDKVDSTLGHFASYLKSWSDRSYNAMKLEVPMLQPRRRDNRVLRNDIFDVLDDIEVDLAYLDPPYGSNNDKMPPSRVRYQAYYHLWTSVCQFDKPTLFGKAARRVDSSDRVSPSIFEEFRIGKSGRFLALEALEKLLQTVRARNIILSYSSGGRATLDQLRSVIYGVGKLVDIYSIPHRKHVMGNMRWTNEWVDPKNSENIEYLFVIQK